MGARVRISLTGEGRRFEQMLRELADREVRIGFQHGEATEEDGTDICDIAMWNELGTEHIPARPFLLIHRCGIIRRPLWNVRIRMEVRKVGRAYESDRSTGAAV